MIAHLSYTVIADNVNFVSLATGRTNLPNQKSVSYLASKSSNKALPDVVYACEMPLTKRGP